MTDTYTIHDAMAAAELASLAAFARSILARARADNPLVTSLRVDASIESGEIDVAGVFIGADDREYYGFTV